MRDLLYILVGVVFLFLGGEGLVRGSFRLSIRMGMTTLMAGLTIVSFATSMPEASASLIAQLRGSLGDIALGNVIGSNIANVGLIAGLTALIRPLRVTSVMRTREMPMMIGALALLFLAMLFNPIGRWVGLVLLLFLILYLVVQVWLSKHHLLPEPERPERGRLGVDLWLIVGGIIGLVVGGASLVEGAVGLARRVGLSEATIGLTVVAVGTSLPELAATLVAAFKGHDEIAIGNVIGSNVFNALFIVGGVSLIRPIAFTSQLLTIDLPIMVGFSLLLWLLMIRQHIGRLGGALLLVGYAFFIAYQAL